MAGLASAAQQLQAYGRAPDTMLAHVSPSEAQFIDYVQGGRKTNPITGLPEYGLFGDILKFVARAAGAIGGFMVGGPVGAAAGAGIATKLTGGSWKDALTSAALSGVGGELGQGLSGGGWSLTGAGNGAGAAAGAAAPSEASAAANPALLGAAPSGASAAPLGINSSIAAMQGDAASMLGSGVTSAIPGAAPSGLSAALSHIGGYGGLAAGFGANLGQPSSQPSGQTALPPQSQMNLNVTPQPRTYNPYQGDPLKFATPGPEGGAGWQFYSPLNPVPQFKARGGAVRGYALGGPAVNAGPSLMGPGQPPQPPMPGNVVQSVPQGGAQGLGAHGDMIRQAALMGYSGIPLQGMGMSRPQQTPMMARGGHVGMPHFGARGPHIPSPAAQAGAIHGPGTGTSDSVPAQLSDGEHVIDSQTVAAFGSGSNNAGHKVIDNLKQAVRRKAGFSGPSKTVNVSGNMISRAQKRAGVI